MVARSRGATLTTAWLRNSGVAVKRYPAVAANTTIAATKGSQRSSKAGFFIAYPFLSPTISVAPYVERTATAGRPTEALDPPLTRARRRADRWAAVVLLDVLAVLVVTAAAAVFGVLNGSSLVVGVGWLIAAAVAGCYQRRRLQSNLLCPRRLVLAATYVVAGLGLVMSLGLLDPAKALGIALAAGALSAAAFVGRLLLLPYRRGSLAPPPIVVIGSAERVRAFVARAHTSPVVAAACLTDHGPAEADLGPAMRHPISDLVRVVREVGAGTVVALDPWPPADLRRAYWQLEHLNIAFAVAPLWDVAPRRVRAVAHGSTTLVEVSPARRPLAALRGALDRGLALIGLMLAAPLLTAIALAVAIDSRGPVFYRQERTGLGGQRFRLWKFRTMVANADGMKQALPNQYAAGTLFKMVDDPRITRVGRLLRRTSLDELPQLLNVLFGQMALVGPRPTSTQYADMPGDYRRRTLVRPGLTGLWQVSGRSDLSWDDSVRLDLHYVENTSWALDARILARTIPAVLQRRGAY